MTPSGDKTQFKLHTEKAQSPIVPQHTSAGKQAFTAVILALVFFGAGFGAARLIATRNGDSSVLKRGPANDLSAAGAPLLLDNTRLLNPDVIVSNQTAGASVVIAELKHDTDTWVAIHEDSEGEPGRILGAQRFRNGIDSGAVDLLRPTTAGGVYYAVLHYDDGDDTFDLAKDIPLRDVYGKAVMTEFKAQ